MAKLTDGLPDNIMPDDLYAVLGNPDHPSTAKGLDRACGAFSLYGNEASRMLAALRSPGLDNLSDPDAILSYSNIWRTFDDREVRIETIRKLDELIWRVAEPHDKCMEILFDTIPFDSYPYGSVGQTAAKRFIELARPSDVPQLLARLDKAIPPKDTSAPTVRNVIMPRIHGLVAALGAAGDHSTARALLAFWDRHRNAWWRSELKDHIAGALIEIGRRVRDLALLDQAETLTREQYPTGSLDFALGAARVECGDVARGVEQMIWRLDRSRSIEPTERHVPEALIKAGTSHFDVLAPYLDEPRLAAQARMIVERVLERAAGALSDAQLQAIAARAQLTGIQVWWDTSKDVYEVSREERVPLDFTRCRDLAAAELARRSATRQGAVPK